MMGIEEIQSEEQFRTTIAGATPVLVDFWAVWCGPCRMVAPVVEELAQELDGQVRFAKVNVDDLPDLAAPLGIQGIPTLILFKLGREIDRIVGAAPKARMRQWLLGAAA
jgi:thioredoxin 1